MQNLLHGFVPMGIGFKVVTSLRSYDVITFSVTQQICATDFASERSLTVGIVFIRVTCKLFEFIGFLYSGHVTFQIWS